MNTYELPISQNYCSSWELEHAFRELIQNGLDQEIIDPENGFYTIYDPSTRVLSFVNEKSELDISSLVLGNSTKSNNDDTIGCFGEGYKIAALVCVRAGKTFTIHNGRKGEEWTCEFRHSDHWCSDVLVFAINKTEVDDSFRIDVGNVTSIEANLNSVWLNKDDIDEEYIVETEYGELILDEYYLGSVFVNGLVIEWNGDLEFGYNFKPKYCKLERDRHTCDQFDAQKFTAKMIAECVAKGKISSDVVSKMISKCSSDVFNADICGEKDKFEEMVCESFEKEYPGCIPVCSTENYERVKLLGGNPVIVDYSSFRYMEKLYDKKIDELLSNSDIETLGLRDRFERWYIAFCNGVSDDGKSYFYELLEKL